MSASTPPSPVLEQPPGAGGRAEAPLVLDTAPPRPLGFRDQAAFWTNLGISLIGFQSAATVLVFNNKDLSLAASITAIVVGTVIGALMLAVAAVIGTRSGAPAMAILRGLFGTRMSYLPTVLNVIQCVGWGVFELTVIAMGADALYGGIPHWVYVVVAGVLTTAMTIRPLGAISVLRRYVAIAVGIAMLFFTVELLRRGVPDPGRGNWTGFLPATDAVIAVSISFVPLAADYTRHARSSASSFWGAFSGYTVSQVWCYVVGLLALVQVGGDPNKIFTTFMGITAGWVFFSVLVLREADQSFANVYSTAMSLHNVFPRADRRYLTVGIGALVTVLALGVTDFSGYENFLGLIGAVFVPLSAVLAVDFFFGAGRRPGGWDMSESAPIRWLTLLPWAIGFAVYELIAPAGLTGWFQWWPDFWAHAQNVTGIHPEVWTSASLFSFLVPALLTWALTPLLRKGH
ncbi:allantoin permease [Streptacidiphilus sp. PB12-B1b]|uniref:purine-cytosine permease family protein n=1 Tax=Streptacidiphilus sp. PB12-B1b TaxID=2705012 RepID=UPI0015F967E0|nr:cytosine permease [Streptacidiphilus sp. PB12-B1b]QMU74515.1 allantoin permease [Streptacidiphilus sp. PB12-B1b]